MCGVSCTQYKIVLTYKHLTHHTAAQKAQKINVAIEHICNRHNILANYVVGFGGDESRGSCDAE